MAAHRNPESYVAGAAPLALMGDRFSDDVDVFHDREQALQDAAAADTALLASAGMQVTWTRRFPTLCAAIIRAGEDAAILEWLVDSAFRFFPALPDPVFGYVLHPADIATNKALAAAGRREPRDIIDLLALHTGYLPLGAILWAACAKDIGFSPEGLVAEIRRNSRYQQADYDRVRTAAPLDGAATARALRQALDEADVFVRAMPVSREGLLFLKDGVPAQPDPARLDDYVAHCGQQRGHWPTSPDIGEAMLDYYHKRRP